MMFFVLGVCMAVGLAMIRHKWRKRQYVNSIADALITWGLFLLAIKFGGVTTAMVFMVASLIMSLYFAFVPVTFTVAGKQI